MERQCDCASEGAVVRRFAIAPSHRSPHPRTAAPPHQWCYQSRYFVPSSPVPPLFEYTSKTFCPPQDVESGLSWYDRKPHSVLLVIGSGGIRRRYFSLRPLASLAAGTPSTSVSRSDG